jgi:hypothetical protein
MARNGSEEIATWLVTLPPTPLQRWSAFSLCAILLLGLGILAPFSDTPLPRINAFIPSFEGIIFVTDFFHSFRFIGHEPFWRLRVAICLRP